MDLLLSERMRMPAAIQAGPVGELTLRGRTTP